MVACLLNKVNCKHQLFKLKRKLNPVFVRFICVSCLVPGSAMRVLVRRPEGKRLRGTPAHRWQGAIKIEHQEMGWGAWTGLIQVR